MDWYSVVGVYCRIWIDIRQLWILLPNMDWKPVRLQAGYGSTEGHYEYRSANILLFLSMLNLRSGWIHTSMLKWYPNLWSFTFKRHLEKGSIWCLQVQNRWKRIQCLTCICPRMFSDLLRNLLLVHEPTDRLQASAGWYNSWISCPELNVSSITP